MVPTVAKPTANAARVQALFSSPLGIISIVPLILYILLSGLAGTDRKRYRIWSRQTAKYGKDVPAQTITILLGTVFRCAAAAALAAGSMWSPLVE